MIALENILDELADRLATRVAERLRGGDSDMVAQAASPLGRRRHCAAVKRRLARGEPGAAIVGRRHLLSPEALAQELARASIKAESPGAPSSSVRAELLAELALLKKGGNRG